MSGLEVLLLAGSVVAVVMVARVGPWLHRKSRKEFERFVLARNKEELRRILLSKRSGDTEENLRRSLSSESVSETALHVITRTIRRLSSRRSREQGGGMVCHSPPCGKLRSLCDLVPSPLLRKRVKKLVADQESHIDTLLAQGRHRAALINRLGTWILFFWYIIQGVVLAFVPFRQKRSE